MPRSGGALSDGAGDTIAFTQITTTASTLNSATALPAPVLANGTSANVVLIAACHQDHRAGCEVDVRVRQHHRRRRRAPTVA